MTNANPMPEANLSAASLPSERGRILFADDDELFRTGFAKLLEKEGFECVCAKTGDEAGKLLRESEFDLFLSDIDMPGNSRLELIEQVPQIVGGLPIILLTGRPTVETAARSVRLPVAAYLVKPPDLAELRTLLRQCIADYRRFRTVQSSRQRVQRWEKELEQIESGFRGSHRQPAADQVTSFTRITLRNVILALADLEESLKTLQPARPGGDLLHKVDVVGALRHTVAVLESTKQNFKSKELAALRKQLEVLLSSPEESSPTAPPAGSNPSSASR